MKNIIEFLQKNAFFKGFSKEQLQEVASIAREVRYKRGDIIIRENEISDNIYLIQKGSVEVKKFEPESKTIQHLTFLHENDVVGEISLLDNEPRSATVSAETDVCLIEISIHKMQELSQHQSIFAKFFGRFRKLAEKSQQPFYHVLVQNLAKNLGTRLRRSNEVVIESLRKELAHEKARVAMGFFIIAIIACLVIYIGVLKILSVHEFKYFTTSLITVPVLVFFATIVFWLMIQSGYPLSFYGITLKYWRGALLDAIIVTPILILIAILFKFLLIKTLPLYANAPLFKLRFLSDHTFLWVYAFDIGVYLLFVPFQELFVRGALQSSFQEFFIGKHSTLLAIVLSNLLFSITHIHVSFILTLGVIVPGLFWGWMYARNKTLLGVCLSHQIFGIVSLYFIGF